MFSRGWVVLALMTTGCIHAGPEQNFLTSSPPQPTAQSHAAAVSSVSDRRQLTDAERRVITSSIASNWQDPDSLQFRWSGFPQRAPANGSVQYCAMVNARKASGEYVGFAPFVAKVTMKGGRAVGATLVSVGDSNTAGSSTSAKACGKLRSIAGNLT